VVGLCWPELHLSDARLVLWPLHES